jgi:catechol 2,3-dioxygenase-like lactoylglutathione lyase family enzyme
VTAFSKQETTHIRVSTTSHTYRHKSNGHNEKVPIPKCFKVQGEEMRELFLFFAEYKKIKMKINLTSVMVEDQEKALKFYTDVLGFLKKTEVPLGKFKWLTVVSPEGPGDIELLLEPMEFPPARVFQKALFDAGIPLTAFAVDDLKSEYERMEKLGVMFKTKPTKMGPVTVAVFDDTCGNLIQLVEK